jgi:hypothetical protein
MKTLKSIHNSSVTMVLVNLECGYEQEAGAETGDED